VSALETFFDNVWIDALWRLLAVLGLMVRRPGADLRRAQFLGRIQMRSADAHSAWRHAANRRHAEDPADEDLRPASADRIARSWRVLASCPSS
jgi:hypothetical protein